MRGKPTLTPEQEAKLLRLDDLAYAYRKKNLALHFSRVTGTNITEKALRHILVRLRRAREQEALARE